MRNPIKGTLKYLIVKRLSIRRAIDNLLKDRKKLKKKLF